MTRADDLAAGKTATVKELAGLTAATREPQTKAILEAWIAGDIHFRESDNLIVVVEETDTGLSLLDLFTGEPVAEAEPGDTKKVKNSTPIKAILRPALAALELSNPDPAARKAAAEQLAKKPNEAALNLLATALDAETDAGARTALENSLIIATLAVGDDQSVLVQLATMGNRLEPTVRGAVQRLVDTPTRAPEVVAAAAERLDAINNLVDLNNFGNNLLFGLSQASVLLLSAIGLAITFGVMRVINMAHGEFIMIGAYTTFVVQSQLPGMPGVALLLSIPLAFGLAFTAGVILERTVIRFLYGRPLETLLATFGVSLVLQQSFRLIFTPQNRPVITPDW
ncbi:MAG: ABC transporter permease subunit, partial [Alphaproteobacteria bacterium]